MSAADSLSSSPPFRRRFSTSSSGSKREEELINAYEAEEERIINILSRKLEQLREDKINLERLHEEESEAHVNRLARELAALRVRHQQQYGPQPQANGTQTNGYNNHSAYAFVNGAQSSSNQHYVNGVSDVDGLYGRAGSSSTPFVPPREVNDPSAEVLLLALRKENESLNQRLSAYERDYVRVTRLNEVYREELIDLRRRLGLPVDNLIGLTPATDPYSQPAHHHISSNVSSSSSPTASMVVLPASSRPSATHSMPIPRPSSTVHRPHKTVPSIPATPLSRSPSSTESPYLLSPIASVNPESYASHLTTLTTPPSSASLQSNPPAPYPMPPPSLTYPSVPPPSLSSSLGSPVISYHIPTRDPPSPVEFSNYRGGGTGTGVGLSALNDRRYSNSNDRRVAETGSLRDLERGRRSSVERGGRIAETGSLARNWNAASSSSASASPTITSNEQSPILGAFVPSLNEKLE